MKKLLVCACVGVAGAVFAQTMQGPVKSAGRLAEKIKAREELIAKLGGMLPKADKEPGIVFLNCQKTVPESALQQAAMTVRQEYHVSCFVRADEFKGIDGLIALAKDQKRNAAVIAVVDDEKLPQLLSAPDNRVSIVNVRPLMADGPSSEKLVTRVWHMAYRGFGMAMGGAWSAQGAGLMRPAESLEELDKITGRAAAPDSHFPIDAFCRARKVATGGVLTYRSACLEGWAPAPTNDIQKMIWDGVKSGKIKDE